jgi:DinB superfamily
MNNDMQRVPTEFKPSYSLIAAEAVEQDLCRLVTSLKETQFHASSLTGGWSVAYCIEHLVLTGHAFLPKWDLALKEAAGRRQHSSGPFHYRWWHRLLLAASEPPYRIKTRTAWAFTPCSRQSVEETLRHFSGMHRELTRRIERSIDVDAGRARVQSPFVSWISYPLGFSFDLALAHERRHLWQAWQIRRQFANENEDSANSATKPASEDGHLGYAVDSLHRQHLKK